MADPQNSDEVVVETGRGFAWKQSQRLRSLFSRQHGIARMAGTRLFPALEPFDKERARTSVARANALPKKPPILGANGATSFEYVSSVWAVRYCRLVIQNAVKSWEREVYDATPVAL
jgi:hypothetical protein